MPVPHHRLDALLLQLDALTPDARIERLVTEALETDGEALVATDGRASIRLHGVSARGATAEDAIETWRRRATEKDAEDAA